MVGIDYDIPFQPCVYSKYTNFTEINTSGLLYNLLIKPLTVTNYKLMLVLIDLMMNLDCAPIKSQALYEALGSEMRSGLTLY